MQAFPEPQKFKERITSDEKLTNSQRKALDMVEHNLKTKQKYIEIKLDNMTGTDRHFLRVEIELRYPSIKVFERENVFLLVN